MTIQVDSGVFTVGTGQTVSGGAPLATFEATSGGQLVNDGTLAESGANTDSGVIVTLSLANSANTTAELINNGTFSATQTTADANNVLGYELMGTDIGVSVVNNGSFSVSSSGSIYTSTVAVAGSLTNSGTVSAYGDEYAQVVGTRAPVLVQNLVGGVLSARGGIGALGVVMSGGEFDNSGRLEVQAPTSAEAVDLADPWRGYSAAYGIVDNAGVISVQVDNPQPFSANSIGISVRGNTSYTAAIPDGAYNIINSGTITAANAIQFDATSVIAAIDNSGTINGIISLFNGTLTNRILNTGTINGDIYLSSPTSLDSSHGTVNGEIHVSYRSTVLLGAGTGMVIMNGGGGTVVGTAGANDTIQFLLNTLAGTTFEYQGHHTWSLNNGGYVLTNVSHLVFTDASYTLITPTLSQDFNGDGHADILFANASGLTTEWNITGSTNLSETQNAYVTQVDPTWQVQGAMDVNGDGISDLVWRNTGTGMFTIWESTGSGFAQNAIVGQVDPSWTMAGLGDFNGDGKDDILWRNSATGTFTIWTSTGTGFTQNTYVDSSVDPSWHVQAVADFNGDGKADILFRNSSGYLTEWQSNGSGFSENVFTTGAVDTSWHVAAVGDFNGDGKADLIFRNDSGLLTEWQSTGPGFTQNVYVAQVDPSWALVGAYDFNGDGKADLLFRNTGSGMFTVWESTGSGFTQNALVDGSVSSAWQIVTHHYDTV